MMWNPQLDCLNDLVVVKYDEMRRTSLTPQQAHQLGDILRHRREYLGMSMRQVSATAGVNVATMSVLEAGTNLSPLPDTLKDVARALGLPLRDLYVIADWLEPDDLPPLKPYLRAKYRDLDEQSIDDLERYAEQLAHKQHELHSRGNHGQHHHANGHRH
jgi:transcriptional regulator with XRE-family HTH domain